MATRVCGAVQATRRRSRRALRLGLVLAGTALGAAGSIAVEAPVDSAPEVRGADRALELGALSRDLVARARSGRADASRFRIDATLYRESLRRLMLASESRPSGHADERALHVEMVRMAALLNAAAECKTGRYVTCPPELMQQLTAQQRRLDEMLANRIDRR